MQKTAMVAPWEQQLREQQLLRAALMGAEAAGAAAMRAAVMEALAAGAAAMRHAAIGAATWGQQHRSGINRRRSHGSNC
jgi:hypothetical protein